MTVKQGLSTLFIWAVAWVSASAQDAEVSNAEAWLSAEQIQTDVALARNAYSRVHPGYTRYGSEKTLDAAWVSITEKAAAQGGMTTGDFYLSVQMTLAMIKCDHTKAELPKALREERKTAKVYLPFHWKLIEGRGIIVKAVPETGLARGDEIIAIDGQSLSHLVDQVSPLIPVDGYTHWAKHGEIAQSREFMGGAIDHFGALMWHPDPIVVLTTRTTEGEERQHTLDRINYNQWSALSDEETGAAEFKNAVTFELLDDGRGYLRVDTFVNYRAPVDPKKIFKPIFKSISDAGVESLILDLRKNGGGSTDAAHELFAHLISRKMKVSTDMVAATLDLDGLREHLWTWDKRALNPKWFGFRKRSDGRYALRHFLSEDLKTIKPARYAFDGELVILTSANNSSGSTTLIAVLDGIGRAVLIGEPTGGSAEGPTAGLLFTLTLPESGVRTRLPFFQYINNVPEYTPGLGITPDIVAPISVEAF
ncbi:MAG: hypothetical protein HKN14_08740, partial [Marinicaulis sp.]|nr:hypothetical protein [Marinicaulis sp.]